VAIANRQRHRKMDLSWLKETAENLFLGVCDNLRRKPGGYANGDLASELEKRGQLSVTLVSNERIRKLNRDWRAKDAATDVLSFPLGLEMPPAGLPFEIGEVVISVEKAAEQAEQYGHSFEREIAFLLTHGLLHVLGFDHETPEDERDMFGRQREILDQAGLSR